MLNEAIKKQFLTSADYFKAKRWEGKPLSYKLKYAISNHPEMTLACFFFGLIAPAICAFRSMNYETSKYKTIEKYRMHFTIVRDDHPNIEEIKKEKEYGREYFPKY